MLKFPGHVTVAALLDYQFFNWSSGKAHGIEGRFLNILSQALRFQYNLVTPNDRQWGRISDDGNWTGLIGMVSRGEADLALTYVAATEGRKQVVDFSEPYTRASLSFAMDLPSLAPRAYTYLYTFDLTTWACTLLFVLVLPFVIGMVYKVRLSYIDLLFLVNANVLRQDLFRSKTKRNLILGCWWLLASILSTSYAAVIASFLTIPLYETHVKNFRELSRAVSRGENKVFTKRGASVIQILSESRQEHLVKIAQAIEENHWFLLKHEQKEDLKIIGKGKSYVLSTLGMYFYYGKPPYSTKFLSLTDSVFIDIAVAVNKTFCCKQALDTAIARVKYAGLHEKLIDDEFYQRWIWFYESNSNTIEVREISFSDISAAFIVLACGCLLAIICLIIEILTEHIIAK